VKKLILNSLIVLSALKPLSAMASVDDEVRTAMGQLQKQINLIGEIEPYVERLDIARLYVLKSATQVVLNSITSNGLGNKTTFQSYQHQIIKFRYSTSFFKAITTTQTTVPIAEIQKIEEGIIKAFGWDDSPYTQITADVFTQLHDLFEQLGKLPVTQTLRDQVVAFTPELGRVIAIAKQGDRPKTFEAARPLYFKLTGLYNLMNEVAAADAAFPIVIEIQGLNEFYAEFAQIN